MGSLQSPGNVGKDSSIQKSDTGNTGSLKAGGPIQSPLSEFGGSASTSQNGDVGNIAKPSGSPVTIVPKV